MSSGVAWHLTWQCGAGHVNHASEPKLQNSQQLLSNPSPSLSAASATCTRLDGPSSSFSRRLHQHTVFTIIDRTTRWLEAIPLKEMTASTCSAVFLSSWVARFGVQATLTSDRGTQFSSATWQQLCSRLGMKHIITTSYHPQANGRVKRAHRQLKDPIRAREAGADWG